MFGHHIMDEFLAYFPTITSLYRVETRTEFVTPPLFPALKYITFSAVLDDHIHWLCDEVDARHSSAQPLLRVRVSRYTSSLYDERARSWLRNRVEVVELDDDSVSLRYTGESDDEMGDDFDGDDHLDNGESWTDDEDWQNDSEEDDWDSGSDD